MNIGDVRDAVQQAQTDVRHGDRAVRDVVALAANRLRIADDGTYSYRRALCDLKRELRRYNMVTRTWEDEA